MTPQRRIAADRAEEAEPVEPGHHDVTQHEIGRRSANRGERAVPVRDGLDVPALAEQPAQVIAHVGVVVGEHDARALRGRFAGRGAGRRAGSGRGAAGRHPTERLFDVRGRALRRRR